MDTHQAIVTVKRSGGFENYIDDPPLTQIGRASAELVGRSLSERSFNIHTIYTSPSLRCLQVSLTVNCLQVSLTLNFFFKKKVFLNSFDDRKNFDINN